jgi:hypothetical protein
MPGLCSGYITPPVRYELGFISQETVFFIVTAMKTTSLA